MEVITKIFNVILTVFFVFVVGTYLNAIQEDRINQEYVTTTVTSFTDNVRKKGRITKKMYNDFVADLNTLDFTFSIDMTYTKDIVTPGQTAGSVITTQESYYIDDIKRGIFTTEADVIDGVVDGEVRFNKGDTFYVCVTSKSKTKKQQYSEMIPWLDTSKYKIEGRAGGLVRDEEWVG